MISAFDSYFHRMIKTQMHFVETSVMDNNHVHEVNILFRLDNKLRAGTRQCKIFAFVIVTVVRLSLHSITGKQRTLKAAVPVVCGQIESICPNR